MEEGVEVGSVEGGRRGEVGDEREDVSGAGTVDVEEEGGVGGAGGEGGEGRGFDVVVLGVGGGVGGGEEVCEEGVFPVWRVPECGGKGDVDFFQAAVGYVAYGGGEARGEGLDEGREVALQIAQGGGHDDFVKGVGGAG